MTSRFRVFTPANVAIYGGGWALAFAAFVATMVAQVDAVGRGVFGVVALTWTTIAAGYFWFRMQYAEELDARVAGYVCGVAVLDVPSAETSLLVLADVGSDIGWVSDFWASRTNVAGIAHQGRAAFYSLLADGGTLTFVPDPIVVETFGQSTEGAPVRLAAGLTQRNHMRVWWPVGDAYQGEPSKRVRHELAHVYLTAAGIAPERHHDVMNQHGFPV